MSNPFETLSEAWKIIPEFHSSSINDTIKFYTTHLHFILGGTFTPPSPPNAEPTFCSLFKGHKAAANIYLRKPGAEETFRVGRAYIAMGAERLEEFHRELQGKEEVVFVEELGDKPWGYRQFGIKDLDGNVLTFFRFLEGGNPGDEGNEDGEKTK